MEDDGPPPYQDVYKYEAVLSHEHDWNDYEMAPAYAQNGELPANLFVSEYDLVQKFRGMASFLDTFAALYPKLQKIDFRTQVTSLDVPVYLVEGVSEARGRVEPAHQWFDVLDAPTKQWIDVPNAGHRALFEQPARFAELMNTIRAETE